jgi:hypothetical protein
MSSDWNIIILTELVHVGEIRKQGERSRFLKSDWKKGDAAQETEKRNSTRGGLKDSLQLNMKRKESAEYGT